jgi:hypothetical protein
MTEQDIGERPPFRMDTVIIPPGVDLDLAKERNAIINAWRKDEIDAESALESMMRLYWTTQQHTNGETNVYLMDVSWQFPVEAKIPVEESGRIYRDTQKTKHVPYVRIFVDDRE